MPSDRPPLTQARLKELLHYDPETGYFTWRVHRSGKATTGTLAGCLNGNGYWQVSVDRVVYNAHRLVFLYLDGELPPRQFQVDHVDRDKTNNRRGNLRLATRSQNAVNVPTRRTNTSGVTNVHWDARHKKWQVRGRVSGRRTTFGLYDSLAAAAFVAEALRVREYGQFVPGLTGV